MDKHKTLNITANGNDIYLEEAHELCQTYECLKSYIFFITKAAHRSSIYFINRYIHRYFQFLDIFLKKSVFMTLPPSTK